MLVVVHEAPEQNYCFTSHTMAAARVQVEVAIEYKPPMEHCYLSYIYCICIINSGRSVKNGSNHNASREVGGLHLEQYSSLNYTFEEPKIFFRQWKHLRGPEWKHLTHIGSSAIDSTSVRFQDTSYFC